MSFTRHEHTKLGSASGSTATVAAGDPETARTWRAMQESDAASALPWRTRPARDKSGAGFVSPAVRRALADTGLDIDAVAGSGTAGRVTHADVIASARGRTAVADVVEQFTAIRKTTAEHVTRSLRIIPHG